MRKPYRTTIGSRLFLSLVILTANVGAPFRTSTLGRAFLDDLRQQQVAMRSIVRVRAISPPGASVGHRVVVGLSKGGNDQAALRENSFLTATLLPSSLKPLPARNYDPLVVRPNPPLRC